MMFDLRKIFAVPKNFLKLNIYCNKNCVYGKAQINPNVPAQFFFTKFYLLVETETYI